MQRWTRRYEIRTEIPGQSLYAFFVNEGSREGGKFIANRVCFKIIII